MRLPIFRLKKKHWLAMREEEVSVGSAFERGGPDGAGVVGPQKTGRQCFLFQN